MDDERYPARFGVADAPFLSWRALEGPAALFLLEQVLALSGIPCQAVHEALPGCYPDHRLLAFSREGPGPALFFLLENHDLYSAIRLDGSNEPIYQFNDSAGIRLDADTLPEYCRLFFHFVRGRLGAFQIVERASDLHWRSDADPVRRAEVEQLLIPLTLRGRTPQGLWRLTTTVLFKDSLFKTDIFAASSPLPAVRIEPDSAPEDFSIGQLALANEQLLIEALGLGEG